jgi:hypothetical protein
VEPHHQPDVTFCRSHNTTTRNHKRRCLDTKRPGAPRTSVANGTASMSPPHTPPVAPAAVPTAI